jgi:predicted phage-related endonuclease
MISLQFSSEEEWLKARLGKVTGTRLKDLVSKRGGVKKGFYEIIAERVALPPSNENVMDRGKRLEEYAIERFSEETGKKVSDELVMWQREDDENIAVSPDGVIGEEEAIECKCLNSASHIEAFVTHKIPDEYEYQVIQYFIVNEKLKTLYFVFYDPRMPKDFFYLTITRDEKSQEIQQCLEIEREALKEINKIEKLLTF